MEICTKTLKEIKLLYSGEALTAMLKAWETFPTYKTDKACERKEKKKLREMRTLRILQKMQIDKLPPECKITIRL